ncbi:MAG TPA: hypothetical protein VKB31_07645 [Trueperaceae bacterium]|nr:hypothetical protein [Trueperaceae bacterium]
MSWAASPAAPRPVPEGPRARLRWAGLADLDALCAVYRAARPERAGEDGEDAEEMAAWLEHGGAILLESEGEAIAALRWREESDGWRVDPAANPSGEPGGGYERWLMTKVEALAIRANIPTLTVEVPSPDALPTYRRMGYRRLEPGSPRPTMIKRVGGTWQVQEEHR